ncbi:uncharacterized protein BDCG_16514 [Blastomyces dermatitidis ER-3]|uniref:Uncharacterized protein n=1 Tax=Ajellomyces dermatitidis (strain ER-3 / ATCC MYA-2586) TaxID=559297 RepID=A0ABX2VSM9_AJEDR|nr:uncharacterized protein BDCG_16514 [Blastomyces dermatitidis ER-3]OAT00212.1 hypothetical protein BDCG_16514 [Blastomyces dermatitidis ER-3]
MTHSIFTSMTQAVKLAMRFFIDLAGGGKTLFNGNDTLTRGGANNATCLYDAGLMNRDLIEKGKIMMKHVGSTVNIADGLTKSLAKPAFEEFVKRVGIQEIEKKE